MAGVQQATVSGHKAYGRGVSFGRMLRRLRLSLDEAVASQPSIEWRKLNPLRLKDVRPRFQFGGMISQAPLPWESSYDIPEPQPEKDEPMSWLSSLGKTVGKDVKAVFNWITSTKGQTVITSVEAGAEAFGAPTAVINLANYWLGKIVSVESLAAAAGSQQGSGAQKAGFVLADVTPQVLAIAKAQGLPTPTANEIQNANNALVAFLNALGGGISTTSTTNAPTPAPTTTPAA